MTTAIPMHHETPQLTHLSYFIIGGGQPKGRTVVVRQPRPSMTEQAAQVIMKALAGMPANA